MPRVLVLPLLLSASLLACKQSDPAETQVSSTSFALSEAASEALMAYEVDGNAFVASLDNGATAADLSAQAQALLDKAVKVTPEYIELFPSCGAHLNGALEITTRWPELTPDEIETGYHAGEALPPEPTGSNCYHMKDVIVHPATALALLKQPEVDRAQVRNEIAEVIAHAVAVRTGVGFNSSDGD